MLWLFRYSTLSLANRTACGLIETLLTNFALRPMRASSPAAGAELTQVMKSFTLSTLFGTVMPLSVSEPFDNVPKVAGKRSLVKRAVAVLVPVCKWLWASYSDTSSGCARAPMK